MNGENLILVITPTGEKINNMSIEDAEKMADEFGLDLVKDSADNVYKILIRSKMEYENKKVSKSRPKNKKTKTIKISPRIDTGDIETKVSQIKRFLKEGFPVQLMLIYKGREKSHREVGEVKLGMFIDAIKDHSRSVSKTSKDGDSRDEYLILPN